MRRADDPGMSGKSGILRRVRDFKYIALQDGMRAESGLTRGLFDVRQANIRLEPLARRIDQAEQRDRCIGHRGGGAHQRIERILRVAVQHVQRLQRG